MPGIDFFTKITGTRPTSSPNEEGVDLKVSAESDRGRIINSAAIRRLQQKTQVFPLERNAAVRSRLTHSLEVQQVGRFIAQQASNWLRTNKYVEAGSYLELMQEIESFVEMGCLMHDIGNPPFGHFGEKAINEWFANHLDSILPPAAPDTEVLRERYHTELCHFEGNAQAIRLISTLLRLNLTFTQAAVILKYTRPAYMKKQDIPADKDYLMKKVGYYSTEEAYVNALCRELHMQEGHRHPLTYIMEAADDISYCFADIEDGVEKGILDVQTLCREIKTRFVTAGGDLEAQNLYKGRKAVSVTDILRDAMRAYDKEQIDKDNQFFISLRVSLQQILVRHAARQFSQHIKPIFHGEFNRALLEDDSAEHKLAETFKDIAFEHIFAHPEVELQELRGYRIINGLLDYYAPLLRLTRSEFEAILNADRKACRHYPVQARLVNKLPGKHVRAYTYSLTKAQQHLDVNSEDYRLKEVYFRCRLIQDYVSGMTDQHSFDEYKSLTVSD